MFRPPRKTDSGLDAPDPLAARRELGLFAWAMLATASHWVELSDLVPLGSNADHARLRDLEASLRASCLGEFAALEPPRALFDEARWLKPAQLAEMAGALRQQDARGEALDMLMKQAGLFRRIFVAADSWLGKDVSAGDCYRIHTWFGIYQERDAQAARVLDMPELAKPKELMRGLQAEIHAVGAPDALHWLKSNPRALKIRPGTLKLTLKEKWQVLMHGVRTEQEILGRRWLTEHPERFEMLRRWVRLETFYHANRSTGAESALNEYSHGRDIRLRFARYAGRPEIVQPPGSKPDRKAAVSGARRPG